MENGWTVITQQIETDLLSPYYSFRTSVLIFITIGIVILVILTILAIRQSVQPINALTETATAITEGDLSRIAPIESEDEIGILAHSFNRMTEQLLELIGNLERRVQERTEDLERRSELLMAAAEVGRVASSVLETETLINQVVTVIRDQFRLYYVGLFIVDEAREWADLRAGTGDEGAALLARGHRIRIGQGMIGWCIANAKHRVSMDVERDAIRLTIPELLQTRAEAAFPLRARGQVIGAISIQDVNPDTFSDVSLLTFQTMADLVGVAIDNARLYSESMSALQASRRAFGEISTRAWQEQKKIGIRSSEKGTSHIDDNFIDDDHLDENGYELTIPIKVRNEVVGDLLTFKPKDSGDWQPEEIHTLELIIEQLGSALESAQLYEETQRRAYFEQLTRQVSDRIRETLDLETILRTATRQLRQSMNLEEVEILVGQVQKDQSN
jgi:nitrate/nitrite-specific signal transduction histidine kinase